jgi:hypothetical protein
MMTNLPSNDEITRYDGTGYIRGRLLAYSPCTIIFFLRILYARLNTFGVCEDFFG